jgi:hypothetical protein
MHKQERALNEHVEFENRDWEQAFNLYLGLSAIFDFLFVWFETVHLDADKITILDLLVELNSAILSWQTKIWFSLEDTYKYPCYSGGFLELIKYPSQISFQLLLHRFFATGIRECCKYSHSSDNLERFRLRLSVDLDSVLQACDPSLVVIVVASQIKIGMWRKNGQVKREMFNLKHLNITSRIYIVRLYPTSS